MAVYNPFDFFLEPHAEQFPFAYEPWQLARAAAVPARPSRCRRASRDYLGGISREPRPHDRLAGRPQPAAAARRPLRHPPGSRRPVHGDDAHARHRLVPRLGVAAGAAAAPPRAGGALRLGLPDPADRRRQSRSTGPAGPSATSPTCTPGARSICRARAGSVSIRPPGCSPAKDTFRSPARPSRRAPRRSPARVDECEVDVRARDVGPARPRIAARDQAVHRATVGRRSSALGARSTRDLQQRRRAADDGRRADLRVVDDQDGAEWNTAALGPTKRAARHAAAVRGCRQHFARERLRAFRPGQVVSGRAAAALGARVLLAQATASRPGAIRRSSPTRRSRTATARPTPSGFLDGARRAARPRADAHVQAGYEDVWYYLWRERRLPVNVDPFDARLDDELERDRLRRVFTQRPRCGGRLRPAARSATRRCRQALAHGPWFLRDERHVPHARRFADGLRLPLDSLPWVAEADTPRARCATRPIPALPPPASRGAAADGAAASGCRRTAPSCRRSARRSGRRRPARGRVGAPDGPDGALRRSPRRRALHLHAAGRSARGLPRARRRRRSRPRPRSACRVDARRLSAARTIRGSQHSR